MAAEYSAQISLLFDLLVRAMVDNPESVSLSTRLDNDKDTVLKVQVAAGDIGKLLGIGGRTARSLRIILAAISKAHGVQFKLDIQAQTVSSE